MTLTLRASVVELAADHDPSKRWMGDWLEVVDVATLPKGGKLWQRSLPKFRFMLDAILTSVESGDGLTPNALKAIRRIESGEVALSETVGNGWIAHIARDRVWFEGLHDQGQGGEVTFAQYKLAVETYVRFLADPERKPIEVPFPEA